MNEDNISYEVETLNGGQLFSKYGGGGSKEATPLGKRSRSAVDSEAESDDSDVGHDDFWDGNDIWDDKRGRWRRQEQSSNETAPEVYNKPTLTKRDKAELVKAAAQVVAPQEETA